MRRVPTATEVRLAVGEHLSPGRAAHVGRVAAAAMQLADTHGLRRDWAELAGLLHDWYREVPFPEIVSLARACGAVPAGVAEAQIVPAALHGPVAARLLPQRWPDLPPEVLVAIDRHTTGDPEMTAFDCLLYVADLIEPGHTFAGVEGPRAAAARDLGEAARLGMEATIERLLHRGAPIDPRTVAARNALLARAATRSRGSSRPLPEPGATGAGVR